MVTNYKRFSRIMTLAAFALLISVGLISFALSGFAEVKQGQTGEGMDTSRVYQLTEADSPPKILQPYIPFYPNDAKEAGVEGRVVVKFVVTKEGIVQDASVVESNPMGVFDQSALEAVEQYTFKPALKDGEAVGSIVRMPIEFRIKVKQ